MDVDALRPGFNGPLVQRAFGNLFEPNRLFFFAVFFRKVICIETRRRMQPYIHHSAPCAPEQVKLTFYDPVSHSLVAKREINRADDEQI